VKFRKRYACSCCGWTGTAREPLPDEPLVLVRTIWPLLGFHSHYALIDWLRRHPEVPRWYLYDMRHRRKRVLTASVVKYIMKKAPMRRLTRAMWAGEMLAAGDDTVLPPPPVSAPPCKPWWTVHTPTKIPAVAKFVTKEN
jgi:hypothetical protein